MIDIAYNLNQIRERIAKATQTYERLPNSVSLLAVSKTQCLTQIEPLLALGQHDLGESYIQEALKKISALNDKKLAWHFIGHLQMNKIAVIARHFSWVHSISRWTEAQKLSSLRPQTLQPLEVCVQVKLDDSPNKNGVVPEDVPKLLGKMATLPQLKIRGLMTLPPYSSSFSVQRSYFKQLREILEQMNQSGFALDTLSMGMSHDLEAAIAEGATIVRVGQGIFGPRTPKLEK